MKNITIAIQGIRGSFHEEAARHWAQSGATIIPVMEFDNLVKSIARRKYDYGIIAVENTIAGSIPGNRQLIAENDVSVCGEVCLPVHQNLAVLPGTAFEELREVRSHPVAIAQCLNFFKSYPYIRLIEEKDTALSIKQIAEQKDKSIGAIGSMAAIGYYGLEAVAENIEDNPHNYTRFLVIEPGQNTNK